MLKLTLRPFTTVLNIYNWVIIFNILLNSKKNMYLNSLYIEKQK